MARKALSELGISVHASAVTPNSPEKNGPGQVNGPSRAAGRVVRPSDIVIGDADGVVVVPQEDSEEAAESLWNSGGMKTCR